MSDDPHANLALIRRLIERIRSKRIVVTVVTK